MSDDRPTRREGERVRVRHAIERMRAHLGGLEVALRLPTPIGTEAAEGITRTALEIAMNIAKHDAYDQAERDALPRTCTRCGDTHEMKLGNRKVPCTGCPVPCDKCRGKLTAFCALTPCACPCHAKRIGAVRTEAKT